MSPLPALKSLVSSLRDRSERGQTVKRTHPEQLIRRFHEGANQPSVPTLAVHVWQDPSDSTYYLVTKAPDGTVHKVQMSAF